MTVLVDLTPIVNGTGPARLVDMHPGRSSTVLSTWLDKLPAVTRDGIEVVTMDGFTGYATAVQQRPPDATKVMDPFHVVHLAAQKLTLCRQRIQQQTAGRRGRSSDPLYRNRKALLTRCEFLTDRQKGNLETLWSTDEDYVPLQATWVVHQRIIDAYNIGNRRKGQKAHDRDHHQPGTRRTQGTG